MRHKIVIIGNTRNTLIADALLKKFDIVGGVIDVCASENNQKKQRDFLNKNNIKEYLIEEAENVKADLFLIFTYGKLIKSSFFEKNFVLNLHGGILPKYRGRSGNLIALLNDEDYLGYTLHAIDSGMDSGPIYKVFKVENNKTDFVETIIQKIINKVAEELNDVLVEILNNALKPEIQEGKYIYTTPLRKEDGIITNWNVESEYLYNLYRIYGYQYASGFYFYKQNELYKIKKMSIPENIINYKAIPGGIAYVNEQGMFVKTLNTCILIEELEKNGDKVEIKENFRIGMRLD